MEQQGRIAQMLIIWTDCDREGEHIGSEIVQICRRANPTIDVYRARYSSVTGAELRRACDQLQRLDLKQVAAVDARIELDLRTGAIFTRYQTLHLKERFSSIFHKEVISYGPCQFPTLGFVVEQYKKVQRFSAEAFWYLELEVEKNGVLTKFRWKRGHLFDRLIALILYERCMAQPQVHVVDVTTKPASRYRPLPLRTVEFQKASSRFLKLSSHKVMEIAEKLYNQGLISYPRTETDVFEFGPDQLKGLVSKQAQDATWGQYASSLLNEDKFRTPRRGKNNDKAHPPIHPTGSGSALTGMERAVFEFVARRFLACCSDDARGEETIVKARIRDESFEAKGIKVTAPNYLLVYKYDRWTDNEIADYVTGEILVSKAFLLREGQTTSPPLLSEADLITCMDQNGIGTDATIHEHINRIIQRKYATKQTGGFVPTRLGMALVDAFDQLGLDLSLTQPKIRAQLERDLARICTGERTKPAVVSESLQMFRQIYAKMGREFNLMLETFSKYLEGGGRDGENGRGGPFEPMPFKGPRNGPPGSGGGGNDNNDRDIDEGSNENDGNAGNSTGSKRKRAPPKKKDPSTTTKRKRPEVDAPSAVQCDCHLPGVLRTVSKEGPNKGRKFYACSNRDGCGFFKWADEEDQMAGRQAKDAYTAKPSGGSSSFSDKRCQCDLSMKQFTARTGPNAGRTILKCAKLVQPCGAFEFLDGGGGRDVGKRQYPSKSDTGKKTCFKCQKNGHWANACPN